MLPSSKHSDGVSGFPNAAGLPFVPARKKKPPPPPTPKKQKRQW